jgi:hypothetical protein
VLDRINLRWVITTTVVVAVAAAGTAATMRQRAECCDAVESTVRSRMPFDQSAVRRLAVEPAQRSRDIDAPRADRPPFEFEGFPPGRTSAFAPAFGTPSYSASGHDDGSFWSSRSAGSGSTNSSEGGGWTSSEGRGWTHSVGTGTGAFVISGGGTAIFGSQPSSTGHSVVSAAPAGVPSALPAPPSLPNAPPAPPAESGGSPVYRWGYLEDSLLQSRR